MRTSWLPSDIARQNRASAPGISGDFLIILVDRVAEWLDRARGRYLLQQLDDRMLRDIGLSRSDVERECAKHFWQH